MDHAKKTLKRMMESIRLRHMLNPEIFYHGDYLKKSIAALKELLENLERK